LQKFSRKDEHTTPYSEPEPPRVITEDVRLQRFFKGIKNIRPPLLRYDHTWDPRIVLDYLQSQPPDTPSDWLPVARKLAVLLALTTGHRIQTIFEINTSHIKITQSRVEIFIPAIL